MNDIEKLINYIKDNSTNFLGSKATLKDLEEFNYMYDQLMTVLEKQLPKKTRGNRVIICQSCKNAYIDYLQKYCQDCGQKLDWSEVENE